LVSMKSQWQLLGFPGHIVGGGGLLHNLIHFYWARKR
jgi:hypothetical protein